LHEFAGQATAGTAQLLYLFADFSFDTDRREVRCGSRLVPVEPQVFDLLEYLIRNRERVISRDELLSASMHACA
jgi:DNA-binding winged helix-turn-helix (wHTH) protein